MERAIEKCTKVVDKHTMSPSRRQQRLKRPELNKWIDDNYDVIARAHLIKGEKEKALEVFQYLVRTLITLTRKLGQMLDGTHAYGL